MSNTVIKVEGLSKRYHLGTIGYGSLQQDLTAWWARLRGVEDPNAVIGNKSRLGKDGEFWALRDLSFDIQAGDRLGIVGRNGAGKSTFLKILSRITAPTVGTIGVKGRIASLLEVGTGFHSELTGRENVFLNGAILGMKRGEIQRKLEQIVDFSGVSEFLDTPVKRYSSGMYVRLAFSVAAHLDADIMIIDEVLAVGDAEFQRKCIEKMEQISTTEGRTILFVSHSMTNVSRLCTKGILLNAGQLMYAGGVAETLTKYSEMFPLTRAGKIETNDAYHVRSSGDIALIELHLDAEHDENTIEIGSELRVRFVFELTRNVENLSVYFAIKDRFLPSVITNVTHRLGNGFAVNKRYTGTLRIDTSSMRPGLYPLYFWIGDSERRNVIAGARTVADEVIGPARLVLGDKSLRNYYTDDQTGTFSVPSQLTLNDN